MKKHGLLIIMMFAAALQMNAAASNSTAAPDSTGKAGTVCRSVRLETKPRTKVTMNGKSVGNTPLTLSNVPHGRHVFTFSLPKYETVTDTVDINTVEPICYTLKLNKEADSLTAPEVPYRTPVATIKRELSKKYSGYIEARFSYITSSDMAAGIAVGADLSHLNIEASYSCGLNSSPEVHWYNMDSSAPIGSYSVSYRPSVLGLRIGMRIRVNNFMTFAPRLGLNHTVLAASLKSANGHMASCLSGTGGVRIFFAINSFIGISVNPEYTFALKESKTFGMLAGQMDGLSAYSTGFSANAGLVFFL